MLRYLALSLGTIISFPVTASNSDIQEVAQIVSSVLCEDIHYLNCTDTTTETCSESINPAIEKCSKVAFFISGSSDIKKQISRKTTDCLLREHTKSIGLDLPKVDACYISGKGQ